MNIYELCAKPPAELTDGEIEAIVARLIELRKEYVAAQAKSARPQKKEISGQEAFSLIADL